MRKGEGTQTNPNRKGIEATYINVIALSRLNGRGVQVEYQYHTHHQEEHEIDIKVLLIFLRLEEKAYQSQNQRKHEVVVVCLVIRDVFWILVREGICNP